LDLSFSRFDREVEVSLLPADLAVLMVGVAARQAASPTALAQAGCVKLAAEARLFAPLDGAFNRPVAQRLVAWKQE
jgi:hypothetical protein